MLSSYSYFVQYAVALNEYAKLHGDEKSIKLARGRGACENEIPFRRLSKIVSDSSQK